MPLTEQEAQRIRARARREQLGRFTGPELFQSDSNAATFAAGSTRTFLSNPVNLVRPLEFIEIVMRTRLTIGGASYTVGVPEAPQTLLERVRVSGTHKRWGNVTPINLAGATAFAWLRCFQGFGNDLIIGTTRSADPGMPFVQTTGLTGGAIGTYDVELHYHIPVGPLVGSSQSAKLSALPFLWNPDDWEDQSIQIELTWGDRTSLGTPAGGTTTAFTAFGSASGNPLAEIYLGYAQLKEWRHMGPRGLVIRSDRVVNPALTAVATGTELIRLAKQMTSSVLVKTGVILTGTTSGVNVFASLSDVQLDQIGIQLDNKELRATVRQLAWKNYVSRMFNTIIPQGYFVLPFVESGNVQNLFRGDKVAGGANLAVVCDVLTASADNRQHVVQEQIYGGPFLGAAQG
jgi:hypothetical protein